MRQLVIAAFLVILVAFGSYYLITQRFELHSYYPTTSVQFPNLVMPRALPSITPGPPVRNLAGFAATPAPKVTVLGTHSVSRSVPHAVTVIRPISVTAPTAPAVTPMPAPAYQSVTPIPFARTPPPVVAPAYPTIGQPASPSPSPSP